MSYTSPSNDLDDTEVCQLLDLTATCSLPDLVRHIWKTGYEWGYERGFEDGKDEA